MKSGRSDPELSQHVRAQHETFSTPAQSIPIDVSMSLRHEQPRNVIF